MRFDLDDIPMLTKACTFEQVRKVYELAADLYLHPAAAVGIACGLSHKDAIFFAHLEDGLRATEFMRFLQFSDETVQAAMLVKISKQLDWVKEATSAPMTSKEYMPRLIQIFYEYLIDSKMYPEDHLVKFKVNDLADALRGTDPDRLLTQIRRT